ncbi:hypothetical protein BZA77DRAFT_305179 [Pyronema omphalodes]|nr:hypothetical protein BZA77DRAFT_305179 [Pyronema omphalodes]
MKILSMVSFAALAVTAATSALPQSNSLEARDEVDSNSDGPCLWTRCTIGGKIDCRPGYVNSGKRRTCGRAMMVKILCCPE